jgi:hypothetical protein
MVACLLRIEDEPEIFFVNENGEERGHDIKTMLILLGEEQCSDEIYDKRKSICDSCEHLKKGELCAVDRRLIRLENRFERKSCPLNKW